MKPVASRNNALKSHFISFDDQNRNPLACEARKVRANNQNSSGFPDFRPSRILVNKEMP
jgi:hypothetical protein